MFCFLLRDLGMRLKRDGGVTQLARKTNKHLRTKISDSMMKRTSPQEHLYQKVILGL